MIKNIYRYLDLILLLINQSLIQFDNLISRNIEIANLENRLVISNVFKVTEFDREYLTKF